MTDFGTDAPQGHRLQHLLSSSTRGTNSTKERLLVLTFVWILSALYTGFFLDRGWVPHDEGMLAQSAERVLYGELPHRDYDESYTGGLTYVHAQAFRVFGIQLLSLRIVLFVAFLAFVPGLFLIALRFSSPMGAGLLTLLAVVWSVPNYFSSMPSWYVLFLGTWSAVFLLREIDTGRKRWLVAAGVCGGLSLLVIVVGLYVIAAALLYLAFRSQVEAEAGEISAGKPSSVFPVFLTICGVGLIGLIALLLRGRSTPSEAVSIATPTLAVTAFLLWRGWARKRGLFLDRFRALGSLVLPFVLGTLVPVVLYVLVYRASDALDALYRGIWVLPMRQIGVARRQFPPLSAIGASVPLGLLLAISRRISPRAGRILSGALLLLLSLLLVASRTDFVYRGIWESARSLPLVVVVVGIWIAWRDLQTEGMSARQQQESYLVLSLTALLSMIQFPFAAPVYFCYIAPLVVLSVASVVRSAPGAYYSPVLAFYLIFAILRINPGYIWSLGVRYQPYGPLDRLELGRGHLRVPVDDRREYEELIGAIRARARGPYLYAVPDCPEVYFLAGRRNPTGVMFDFLRAPPGTKTLLALLENKKINALVENQDPGFSPSLSGELKAALERHFPRSRTIGRFVLRWKESAHLPGEKH